MLCLDEIFTTKCVEVRKTELTSVIKILKRVKHTHTHEESANHLARLIYAMNSFIRLGCLVMLG